MLSALMANAGFKRLLNSVKAVPDLSQLVQDGAYLTALQEASRQSVQNLAELATDRIASQEVRAATEQVLQALQPAPGDGGVAGTVDRASLQSCKVTHSSSFPGEASWNGFWAMRASWLSRTNASVPAAKLELS